jgi:hypothetical protein
MSFSVPKFSPNLWLGISQRAIGPGATRVQQIGPSQFQASYEDEVKTDIVPFEQGDIGEEHPVRVDPRWKNQKDAVVVALFREMTQGVSKAPRNGYIFVKSIDDPPWSDVREGAGVYD